MPQWVSGQSRCLGSRGRWVRGKTQAAACRGCGRGGASPEAVGSRGLGDAATGEDHSKSGTMNPGTALRPLLLGPAWQELRQRV